MLRMLPVSRMMSFKIRKVNKKEKCEKCGEELRPGKHYILVGYRYNYTSEEKERVRRELEIALTQKDRSRFEKALLVKKEKLLFGIGGSAFCPWCERLSRISHTPYLRGCTLCTTFCESCGAEQSRARTIPLYFATKEEAKKYAAEYMDAQHIPVTRPIPA